MSVTASAAGTLGGWPPAGRVPVASGAPSPARAPRGDRPPAPLPALPALRPLLPGGGLRRGSVVSVSGGVGATSLLLALAAGVSAGGGWCAVVGPHALGPLAAAELGVVLERWVTVDDPGPVWPAVVAALLDGFDLVVVRPRSGARDARRLVARARERGAVLLCAGAWEGADLRLSVSSPRWHGVGEGHGLLRSRCLSVRVDGRGAAARPRTGRVWLPAPDGGCVADGSSPTAGAAPAAGDAVRR